MTADQPIYRSHPADDVAPTTTEEAHTIMLNRVSWGAIFAGVVVALVVQVLLTMLGAGLGIATIDPASNGSPDASTFSVATGIWYVVSGILASFAGGYIASRMSGRTVPTTGALHGLTTWAFTTLVVLYLLSTAVGSIVGGAFSGVASAVGGVGQTVAQAAAPALANSNPLDAIKDQVQATGTDPQALAASATDSIQALVLSDDGGTPEARQKAAETLAQARNIPVDQAQQQVDQIVTQVRQSIDTAKQTAIEAADTAASVVSTGALLAFFGLVLGGVAAWFGGRSGVVHPIYADRLVPGRRRV